MSKNKILVWSNNISKITGQNIITKSVLDLFSLSDKNCFFYSNDSILDFLEIFIIYFKFLFSFLNNGDATIYLVASRSLKGFLRDLPILLLGFKSRKIIVHIHGSEFTEMFEWRFYSKLVKLLYSNCDVIVPNYYLYLKLDKKMFKSLSLIENFSKLEIEKKPKFAKKNNFRILWNSNIMASKGFIEVFEAYKKISTQFSDLEFIVTGKCISDYEKSNKYMKIYLNKNKATKNFKYMGLVNRTTMSELLSSTDLVLLPSTYKTECQPLALIEAMYYGITIITTRIEPIKFTLGNYPAYFVKREINDIFKKMLFCYQNKKNLKRNIKLNIKNVKKRFSAETFANKVKNVFENN